MDVTGSGRQKLPIAGRFNSEFKSGSAVPITGVPVGAEIAAARPAAAPSMPVMQFGNLQRDVFQPSQRKHPAACPCCTAQPQKMQFGQQVKNYAKKLFTQS